MICLSSPCKRSRQIQIAAPKVVCEDLRYNRSERIAAEMTAIPSSRRNQPKPVRQTPLMRENLHFPRFWQSLGWLLVAAICWLSLTPHPPQPPGLLGWDKGQHCLAYAALMLWFRQTFQRHWLWPLFLIALGIILEFLQGLSGFRSLDLFDMTANGLGVLMGLGLAHTVPLLRIEYLDRFIWLSCRKGRRAD